VTAPLRLALLHPFHWDDVPRGGERYFADLAWWLQRQGHDVDLITGTDGAAMREEADGITVHRLPHLRRQRLEKRGVTVVETFGVRAFPVLRRQKYDVVHALTPTTALAARLARQRTLMTALGHPTPEQFGHKPLDRRLAKLSLRSATLAAAFSEASAQQVRDLFQVECVVLPLGVRTADFAPRLAPRTGPPRLLFAGFAGAQRKGIDLALRAMPRILDVHPDARLLVPGDRSHHAFAHDMLGGDRGRVLDAVDDLGVLPMDAMPELYRSATVSVLPARWEAFGVSLVESLACGTPVVCTDDGGMPGIVSDARVGVVVPNDDVDALARALLQAIELAGRPGTPAACSAHARGWDWDETIGPLHEQVYRDVAVQ
jgi:phosphatidyl-myo-inositol alpha-mannosyltransferase